MFNFLHDLVCTRQYGNFTAITTSTQSYTYDELHKLSTMVAAYLQHINAQNKHVAILLGNRAETIISMFAVSKAGSTFINLNLQLKGERLHNILNHSDAEVLIADAKLANTIREYLPQSITNIIWVNNEQQFSSTSIKEVNWEDIVSHSNLNPTHTPNNELACIMYTSGSTGTPKGVMCPHTSMIAAVDSINTYLHHTHTDKIFTTLPLSHGYGLYQVLTGLRAGATIYLEPGFLLAQPVLRRIAEVNPTGFAVVPTMLAMIFKVKDWPNYLGSLRYITNAGAGLPDRYYEILRDNLPHTDIIPMYGQTECVRALYLPSQKKYESPLPTGIAIPNAKCFCMKDGELVVSGPMVMDGYYKDPDTSNKTFYTVESTKERTLFTGDIFEQKGDLFYYKGRKDDMVKVRGERVSPKEIEDALYSLIGVEQAIVLPVIGELETQLIAHIVTNVDLTKNDVLKWCRQHLEPFMIPTDVKFWNEFPKNDNGKIDRKMLARG